LKKIKGKPHRKRSVLTRAAVQPEAYPKDAAKLMQPRYRSVFYQNVVDRRLCVLPFRCSLPFNCLNWFTKSYAIYELKLNKLKDN